MTGVRIGRIIRGIFRPFFLLIIILVSIISIPFVTYKDHRVSEGAAYGFVIGETAEQTYARAIEQKNRGRFEVFELGRGSGALPYDGSDPRLALASDHWQLVVDKDWWNNVIYISFTDGRLSEIWRFRLCCEMP